MATMGTGESDQCRQVTVIERLKQESMYGLSTKKNGGRCREVAVTGGSTHCTTNILLVPSSFFVCTHVFRCLIKVKPLVGYFTRNTQLQLFSHTYKRADHNELCSKQFLNIIVIQRSDPNYLSFCNNVSPYMSLFRWCFINFNCYVTRQKYVSSLLPTAKVHKIPVQNKVYTFTKESTNHDRYGPSSC